MAVEGVDTKIVGIQHPSLRFSPAKRPSGKTRVLYRASILQPGQAWGVHNDTIVNCRRALNERVFYRDAAGTLAVRPVAGAYRRMQPFERDWKTYKIQSWSRQEVVDSYKGRLNNRYSLAKLLLDRQGLERRDCQVKAFVKCEKIDFAAKVDPAPRLIQPRNPKFGLEFGRFIKPVEHKIYKTLGEMYQYPCVAKGFNCQQLGTIVRKKWNLFSKPCAIGLDASRFDQHVSVEALQWTHRMYQRWFGGTDAELLNELTSKMYVNRGKAVAKDGELRYVVRGSRMSGDMDTALGNCLLMVAMTYSLCATLGIRHELIDNGDDCTIIMDRRDEQLFRRAVKDWYRDLGFDMKVEPTVYILERLEFCQTQPVFDGIDYIMTRQPKCLSKDLCSFIDLEQLKTWYGWVGVGGLAAYGNLPVYGEFYRMLIRNGNEVPIDWQNKITEGGWKYMLCGVVPRGKGDQDRARMSFHMAFGIDPNRQSLIEDYYRAASLSNNVVRYSKPELLFGKDVFTPRGWLEEGGFAFDGVHACNGLGDVVEQDPG